MRLMYRFGFLLIGAIILVILMAAIGVMVTHMVVTNTDLIVKDEQPDLEIGNIAESAFNIATGKLMTPIFNERFNCQEVATTEPVDLFNGQYELETTYFYPSSPGRFESFNGKTLKLTSTTGYAPKGAVMIDDEMITYTGINGNTLTGIERGQLGSQTESHAANSVVSQNMCFVKATSYIPNKQQYTHTEYISGYIPITEAWVAGQTDASIGVTQRYDGAKWTLYNQGLQDDINLLGATSNSYQDAWVVGDARTLLNWNGSNWRQDEVFAARNYAQYPNYYDTKNPRSRYQHFTPNKSYYDIVCTAHNQCWAVGERHKIAPRSGLSSSERERPTVIHWDGNIWVRALPKSAYYRDLFSVDCAHSGFCMAVGDRAILLEYDADANDEYWQDAPRADDLKSTHFNGVSCPADNLCFAVGRDLQDQGLTIAKFNGQQWQNVHNAIANVDLEDIDCPTADFCIAVGEKHTDRPMIVKYENGQWQRFDDSHFKSKLSNNEHSNALNQDLYAVSCASPSNCIAVGENGTHFHFNGTDWYVDARYSGSTKRLYDVGISAAPTPAVLFRHEHP